MSLLLSDTRWESLSKFERVNDWFKYSLVMSHLAQGMSVSPRLYTVILVLLIFCGFARKIIKSVHQQQWQTRTHISAHRKTNWQDWIRDVSFYLMQLYICLFVPPNEVEPEHPKNACQVKLLVCSGNRLAVMEVSCSNRCQTRPRVHLLRPHLHMYPCPGQNSDICRRHFYLHGYATRSDKLRWMPGTMNFEQ